MKIVVLTFWLLAVVGGTASAAIFAPSPEARPPGPKPAKISGVLHPAAAAATDTGRSPVPLMRLPKAPAPQIASLTEPPAQFPPARRPVTDSSAKAAIERDGYKGVSGLTCNEGRCTGQALRGQTVISITVEPDGSVRSN